MRPRLNEAFDKPGKESERIAIKRRDHLHDFKALTSKQFCQRSLAEKIVMIKIEYGKALAQQIIEKRFHIVNDGDDQAGGTQVFPGTPQHDAWIVEMVENMDQRDQVEVFG